MQELISISTRSLDVLKGDLKDITIRTKDEAIDTLNIISAIDHAKPMIKDKCYKKLDTLVEPETKIYKATNGNTVRKVYQVERVYKPDATLSRLEKQLEKLNVKVADLKEKIKQRKSTLKYDEVVSSHYYKSV